MSDRKIWTVTPAQLEVTESLLSHRPCLSEDPLVADRPWQDSHDPNSPSALGGSRRQTEHPARAGADGGSSSRRLWPSARRRGRVENLPRLVAPLTSHPTEDVHCVGFGTAGFWWIKVI